MATDKQERRQKFEGVFAKLRDDLVDRLKGENMPPEAVEWYRRNLDFNVPGGKLNRGMSVVDSVEILRGRKLTEDEYFKAALLGWCIELLQAFFLVSDDMMDHSITRRGQPCWYRVEGVGLIAINDAFMLEGAIYLLLKTHFREEPYYVHLLELFHDTTFQTEMGQLVDLITAPEDRIDLSQFSLKKHAFIVQYKTAYYSFYLSVALAMRVCGVPESYEVHGQTVRPYEVALSILLPLGEYFQIQDDFLDYAGTPEQIGKIGTDIVDNKCSWCVNVALAEATPEQRAVLDANYGRKDGEKEARVKEVYEAIGLRERYRVYEEEVKTRIDGLIASVPEPEGNVDGGVLKRGVFTAFLNKIYKRTK
ncbi:farnesyl-diphosphate synthase [Boletus reticuloceps]|uniref:(2E,6E)-farnesyl diphosphate synthase n=1 Tax=Boletus reticuloceps TaxID=495285 RepID=A0A8I2YVD7_9AGAM|nr:farnesyl-diphosphate synthase [Boletus reticuloceps]